MSSHKPLSRWAVIEESRVAGRRFLVWTMHHSVYDGWSAGRILILLCSLLSGDGLPSIPPVSRFIQYVGQRGGAASQSFWKDHFMSSTAVTFPQVPKGYQPHPKRRLQRRFRVSQHPGLITTALTLRAAWALLIATYTASDDVVIYVTDSGRNVPVDGIMEIIAPTITSMPIRIRVEQGESVRDFLSRIQAQAVEIMPFAHTGLQNIRRAVPALGAAEINLGHLLTVQTAAEQTSQSQLSTAGIQSIQHESEGFLNYALNLECITGIDDGSSVAIEVLYDELVISAPEVEGLFDSFVHVCQVLLQHNQEALQDKHSDHLISDLRLLSDNDMSKLIEWTNLNPTGKDMCIHDIVVQRALDHPGAAAIEAWDGSLTYRELSGASLRLAHHLISLGAASEVNIGVCMEKSSLVPVVMLAILRAGAVVVPLSVKAPISRTDVMLKDAKVSFIVSDRTQRERMRDIGTPAVEVNNDFLQRLALNTSCSSLSPPVRPTNAAWILYTSGSTGVPKGVVLTHTSISTALLSQGAVFGHSEQTRHLHFADHTFDATLQEVFNTLCHGGCVCIPSEHERMNELVPFMADMNVNTAFLTPTVAGIIPPTDVPALETLVLIGEAVKPDIVDTWLPFVTVFNGYGPSECSIISTTGPIKRAASASNIGRSTAGCCWVVSSKDVNRLVPIGAPGELLIEGPLLAKGYLNDDAKTIAKFINDPTFVRLFNASRNTGPRRMYRTGDLVRQQQNGSFVYLGRIDAQVKLRGQRVETGEVETWLRRLLPDINASSVHLVQSSGREPKLVAAVEIGTSGITMTDWNLEPENIGGRLSKQLLRVREELADRLPNYMVPSAVIPVKHLPMNSSGKLDRKKIQEMLQDMDPVRLERLTSTVKQPPSSFMEERLQHLWAIALKRAPETIGANDHFFYIGGDSVTAMRMVAAAQQSYTPPVPLTVMDIFRHPRLSALAKVLSDKMPEFSASDESAVIDPLPFTLLDLTADTLHEELSEVACLCGLDLQDIEDAYPCTPLQEGLMTLTAQQPRRYVSQRVFELDDDVRLSRFIAAWDDLAASVPILRTRIVPHTRFDMLQVVVKKPLYWNSTTDTLGQYLDQDKAHHMTYGQPLCRLAMVTPSGKRYSRRFFVWTMHHSIYDGWSLPKLLQAIGALMNGASKEIPAGVPMTRFIHYLQRRDHRADTDFWRHQLNDAQFTAFPPSPRSSNQLQALQHSKCSISIARTNSRSSSMVTTSTILRAAWAIVLSTYTASTDVVLNVVSSGRNAPIAGMLDVIGPTVTSHPVRIRVDPQQDVPGFLEKLQRQATDMIPFEHTGMQNIRRMVSILGDTSSRDPFGHMFVVQTSTEALDRHDNAEKSAITRSAGMRSLESNASGFYSHGFNLACIIESDHIALEAWYDDMIISEPKSNAILEQLGHVFQSLSKADSEGLSTRRRDPVQTALTVGDVGIMTKSGLGAFHDQITNPLDSTVTYIPALFLETAKRQPTMPAIHAWDGILSYEELSQLSGRLAQHLLSTSKVPAETMVAVSMEKSKWALVAMLAVLRAGGAVVPLGVNLPKERTRMILNDTAAALILTDESQFHQLSEMHASAQLLQIDSCLLESLDKPHSLGRELDTVDANSAAWVIYTSGSTGVPKGVVLTHGSLATSLKAQNMAFRTNQQTRQFQFASYTFDVSIHEMFGTLCHAGGCVCVPHEKDRMGNLAGAIQDLGANTLTLTSTVARLISPKDVPGVQTLILTGEAVAADVVETWLGHEPKQARRVFNAYGPAECTIFASCKALQTKDDAANIGTPLSSCFWITKPDNPDQLVPQGAVGELLVEGPILARGYLRNPEKTAEAFIRDPRFTLSFGLKTGRRMYRTGDLVVQNEDGSFKYIGRRDTQIKINGQRVELGEIESAITRLIAAKTRVAVGFVHLHHLESSNGTLVCAVESAHSSVEGGLEPELLHFSAISQSQMQTLRRALLDCLPAYMVPAFYIPVSHVPLTSSGKIDRLRLGKQFDSIGAEQWQRLVTTHMEVATPPKTTSESHLRAAWAVLFGMGEVSIDRHADFFRLGGDSITAMRLAAQLQTRDLVLPVPDIFKYPRLSEMALYVQAKPVDGDHELELKPFSLLKTQATGDIDELFSSVIYPGTGVTSREMIEDVQPVTDFQAHSAAGNLMEVRMELYHFVWTANGSPPNLPRLRTVLAKLTSQIQSLRTAFVPFGDSFYQVIFRQHDPRIISELVENETMEEALTRLVHKQDMFGPVRPGQVPFELAIVDSPATKQHSLVFRMSHALYDGLTLPMIWSGLQTCYNYSEGHQTNLQHPPFSHFMLAQRKTSLEYNSQAYWRSLLKGASMPQIGNIPPLERTQTSATSGLEKVEIPWSGISLPGITASIILKAAWALVLRSHTGASDISFAEITSGRNSVPPRVAGAPGCCVAAIPVRLQLDHSTVEDLLYAIREQQLASADHQGTGLRTILKDCTNWRSKTFQFSSIVNHRQYDASAATSRMTLDKTEYSLSIVHEKEVHTFVDVYITSVQRTDRVDISLAYAIDSVGKEIAQNLLAELVHIVGLILKIDPKANLEALNLRRTL